MEYLKTEYYKEKNEEINRIMRNELDFSIQNISQLPGNISLQAILYRNTFIDIIKSVEILFRNEDEKEKEVIFMKKFLKSYLEHYIVLIRLKNNLENYLKENVLISTLRYMLLTK